MKRCMGWFACLPLVLFLVACQQDLPTGPPLAGSFDGRAGDEAAKAVQRPFSDYTSTQGTYCFPDGEGGCFDFEPPLKNFVGWVPPDFSIGALFEYIGNAEPWLQENSDGAISLGTDITGTVTEQPLEDGRALVHINVRARNILTWVIATEDFYLDPIIFGSRVTDVLAGAPPALGDFYLEIRFISAQQQAPIPDLFQLFNMPEPGQEILHVTLSATATGILHEGSGYPEGTPGQLRVVQVYPPLPDTDYWAGWSVERVELRPLGGGRVHRPSR